MSCGPDAIVVGSGPNGLAAAVTLARAGLAVEVYEGADTPAAAAYRRLYAPLVRTATPIVDAVLSPLRSFPAHPVALARFGRDGLLPARILARRFETDQARALLAGAAAHSMLPLDASLSGAFGLLLTTLAHTAGWPVVEGGSARIVDALLSRLEAGGGRVMTGRWVRRLAELPTARLVLLDVTPRQLIKIAGADLNARRRRSLARFRYGPGVCKVDWALDGPVPWSAEACRRTATVHVGGTFDEVAGAEAEVAAGRHPDRPFCIVVQPSVVDPTRAPAGRHSLWAYCHTPPGSSLDMTDRIEAQIERFAPGFRDRVLKRVTATAVDTEAHNPNYVGGDINASAATLLQTIARPTRQWNPYRTGIHGVYLCSASTPPGGGVHGMCGYGAAHAALGDLR